MIDYFLAVVYMVMATGIDVEGVCLIVSALSVVMMSYVYRMATLIRGAWS